MKWLVVRLSLAAALATAGCTNLQPRTVRIDSAAGMYRNVNINYRVDTGRLSEPLIVSRISGRRIRQQLVPSNPDRSMARLSIQYPHPEGKEGYALAEVVIETRAPRRPGQSRKPVWEQWVGGFADAARGLVPGMPTSDTVYEAWAMDLPRSELDRAVGGLSQGGFFISPPRPVAGVDLAAKIDGYPVVKRWTHVPELDSLVERIRQDGQLISYTHPIDSDATVMALAGQEDGSGYQQAVSPESDGPSLTSAGPALASPTSGAFGPPPVASAGGPSAGRSLLPIPDPASNLPSMQAPALPSQGAPPRRWQYPLQYRRQAPQYGAPPAMPNMAGPPAVRSRYAPPSVNGQPAFPPPPSAVGGETISGERVVSDAPVSKPRRSFFSRWQRPAGGAPSNSSGGAAEGSPLLRRFPFLARPSGAQPSLAAPPGMPEPPRGTGMDNYYPR